MARLAPWTSLVPFVLLAACSASDRFDAGSAPDGGSLVVSPAADTLAPESSVTFSAVLRSTDGAVVPDTLTWSTSGGTVDSAGHYLAPVAPGTYLVIASDSRRAVADTAHAVVIDNTPPGGARAGYYVAPGGASTNDGSAGRPWPLATALAGAGGRIHPGDTVWLRGGTYPVGRLASQLTGTSSAPIIVRQYPGERATIQGHLVLGGADTWYWGFEVANTSTSTVDVMGVDVHAPRTKLINLTVHDATGNGIGVWSDAPNSEVVGCVLYNNGWQAAAAGGGYGHGIYAQSPPGATVTLRDNVLYDQFGWGIHAYAEGGTLSGFLIEGNAAWNNGAPAKAVRPAIFVGGYPAQAERVTVRDNVSYVNRDLPWYPGSRNVDMGWSAQNRDVRVENNWMMGSDPALRLLKWSTAVVRNNRIISSSAVVDVIGGRSGYQWTGNTWYQNPTAAKWRLDGTSYTWEQWKQRSGLGSTDVVQSGPPTGAWVRVRKHPYEAGGGLIVVMNWSKAGSVSVDVSSVIPVGARYEVRNANAPFGAPLLSGTYGGGTLLVPMTGIRPPTPLRGWAITPPVTGPEFGAFLITKGS